MTKMWEGSGVDADGGIVRRPRQPHQPDRHNNNNQYQRQERKHPHQRGGATDEYRYNGSASSRPRPADNCRHTHTHTAAGPSPANTHAHAHAVTAEGGQIQDRGGRRIPTTTMPPPPGDDDSDSSSSADRDYGGGGDGGDGDADLSRLTREALASDGDDGQSSGSGSTCSSLSGDDDDDDRRGDGGGGVGGGGGLGGLGMSWSSGDSSLGPPTAAAAAEGGAHRPPSSAVTDPDDEKDGGGANFFPPPAVEGGASAGGTIGGGLVEDGADAGGGEWEYPTTLGGLPAGAGAAADDTSSEAVAFAASGRRRLFDRRESSVGDPSLAPSSSVGRRPTHSATAGAGVAPAFPLTDAATAAAAATATPYLSAAASIPGHMVPSSEPSFATAGHYPPMQMETPGAATPMTNTLDDPQQPPWLLEGAEEESLHPTISSSSTPAEMRRHVAALAAQLRHLASSNRSLMDRHHRDARSIQQLRLAKTEAEEGFLLLRTRLQNDAYNGNGNGIGGPATVGVGVGIGNTPGAGAPTLEQLRGEVLHSTKIALHEAHDKVSRLQKSLSECRASGEAEAVRSKAELASAREGLRVSEQKLARNEILNRHAERTAERTAMSNDRTEHHLAEGVAAAEAAAAEARDRLDGVEARWRAEVERCAGLVGERDTLAGEVRRVEERAERIRGEMEGVARERDWLRGEVESYGGGGGGRRGVGSLLSGGDADGELEGEVERLRSALDEAERTARRRIDAAEGRSRKGVEELRRARRGEALATEEARRVDRVARRLVRGLEENVMALMCGGGGGGGGAGIVVKELIHQAKRDLPRSKSNGGRDDDDDGDEDGDGTGAEDRRTKSSSVLTVATDTQTDDPPSGTIPSLITPATSTDRSAAAATTEEADRLRQSLRSAEAELTKLRVEHDKLQVRLGEPPRSDDSRGVGGALSRAVQTSPSKTLLDETRRSEARLSHELSTACEQNRYLEAEHLRVLERVIASERSCASAREESARLAVELESGRSELDAAVAERDRLAREVDAASARLGGALRGVVPPAEGAAEEQLESSSPLSEGVAAIEDVLAASQASVKTLRAERAGLVESVREAEDESRRLSERVSSLERGLAEAEEESERAAADAERRAGDELEAVSTEKADLQTRFDECRDTVRCLHEEKAGLVESLRLAEVESRRLMEKVAALEEETRLGCTKLKEEMKQAASAKASIEQRLKRELAAMSKEREELQEQFNAAQSTLKSLREENEDLVQSRCSAEVESQRLLAKIEALEGEMNANRVERTAELEGAVDDRAIVEQRLREELDAMSKDKSLAEEQLAAMREAAQNLQSRHADLTESKRLSEKEALRLAEKIGVLEQDIHLSRTKFEEESKRIAIERASIEQQWSNELTAVSKDKVEVREQLAASQNTIQSLQKEKVVLIESKRAAEEETQRLQQKLSSMDREICRRGDTIEMEEELVRLTNERNSTKRRSIDTVNKGTQVSIPTKDFIQQAPASKSSHNKAAQHTPAQMMNSATQTIAFPSDSSPPDLSFQRGGAKISAPIEQRTAQEDTEIITITKQARQSPQSLNSASDTLAEEIEAAMDRGGAARSTYEVETVPRAGEFGRDDTKSRCVVTSHSKVDLHDTYGGDDDFVETPQASSSKQNLERLQAQVSALQDKVAIGESKQNPLQLSARNVRDIGVGDSLIYDYDRSVSFTPQTSKDGDTLLVQQGAPDPHFDTSFFDGEAHTYGYSNVSDYSTRRNTSLRRRESAETIVPSLSSKGRQHSVGLMTSSDETQLLSPFSHRSALDEMHVINNLQPRTTSDQIPKDQSSRALDRSDYDVPAAENASTLPISTDTPSCDQIDNDMQTLQRNSIPKLMGETFSCDKNDSDVGKVAQRSCSKSVHKRLKREFQRKLRHLQQSYVQELENINASGKQQAPSSIPSKAVPMKSLHNVSPGYDIERLDAANLSKTQYKQHMESLRRELECEKKAIDEGDASLRTSNFTLLEAPTSASNTVLKTPNVRGRQFLGASHAHKVPSDEGHSVNETEAFVIGVLSSRGRADVFVGNTNDSNASTANMRRLYAPEEVRGSKAQSSGGVKLTDVEEGIDDTEAFVQNVLTNCRKNK